MSLTLVEARIRAALVSDVSYDLALDLTGREDYGCRATISFLCAADGAETFLELATAREVLLDGLPATTYDGRRLGLTCTGGRNEVTVEARIPYVTDGDGMHTFTDPADSETYVGAYVGMDLCQRIFPCFDQNDLKAPVTLTVVAPAGWSVVANGRLDDHTVREADTVWRFGTTPPIPLPMFTVCAGPWHSIRWDHAGPDGQVVPFAWHARASLAGQLDRDADELRAVTKACYDEYLTMFSEPFAFGSFDQVFVPGLNWGALENPGCVTYRDEILPVGTPTEGERRRRGSVIAHEMAHQWFGNLSTMTWWEDTWLQESFADYMGYRVSDAAGFTGAFVDFSISGKPRAYAADERRSTHPVAPEPEDVADVDEAFNNFDAISYAKGNSVIQQLVTWLGDEAFLAGVNAYFARHRFGNATLADFVDALDGATARDVRAWVEAWLRTTGFDTIRTTRDDDGIVLTREGTRPHRVSVTTYGDDLVATGTTMIDLADDPVRLRGAPVVVPNAGNETFARLRLDAESWSTLSHDLASVADDSTRAVVWATAIDLVRCGDLTPEDFLGLVTRHVPRERSVAIIESVLGWARRNLVAHHLAPAAVPAAIAQVAAACETGLAAGPEQPIAVALTRALAATSPDSLLLGQWLVDRQTHTALPVEPALRWSAIHRIASLGAMTAKEIDEERIDDGTIVGVLGAAGATAALPTPGAKAAAWDRLLGDDGLSNREFEAVSHGFWDPEQTGLVHDYLPRYLHEGLAVALRRGPSFEERLGKSFPMVPFADEHVAALEDVLRADVPTVLRRAWEDALDDLTRTR